MRKELLLSAIMLAASSCALMQTAPAQTHSAQTALNESTTPTAIQQSALPDLPAEMNLKSLDSSWRRFNTHSKNDPFGGIYGKLTPKFDMVMAELGIGVHFTRGDTVLMGKENYLIAYRVDPGLEPEELQEEMQQRLQALMGHGEQATSPRPEGKFGPNAKLKLSLLNLQNIGDLEELRAFSPAMDILSPKELRELSVFNLQRLGQLFNTYSQNQMSLGNANQVQQMLRNYHQPVSLLRNPADEKPYSFNPKLNGKKVNSIKNRKAVVMVYEATPASDNTRGVLFLDWRVERIPEWKWSAVRAVQPQLPNASDYRAMSAQRMKLVFQQMLSWAQTHRKLPTTANAHVVRQSLMEANDWNPTLYQEPQTRQQYRFNPAVSNLNIGRITNKNRVVALYEPALGGDGQRGAIFLDGVVRRVDNAQWKAVIRTQPRLKRR